MICCEGKSGPNATCNLFFLGLRWPWVGEFVGFIILRSSIYLVLCFPTQQNLVTRKNTLLRERLYGTCCHAVMCIATWIDSSAGISCFGRSCLSYLTAPRRWYSSPPKAGALQERHGEIYQELGNPNATYDYLDLFLA